jgi:hypothetical protein
VIAGRPGAYSAYVIGSPSIWADATVIERVEKAIATAKGGRVFIAVASHEDMQVLARDETPMLTGFARLDAAFRRQSKVVVRSQIYQGEGHMSVYPRLLMDALPFVLPPRRPLTAVSSRMSARQLARWAGIYALPDGRRLTIGEWYGQVSAQVGEAPKVLLDHDAGGRFYAPSADVDLSFDSGGVTLTAAGAAPLRAERVQP